MSERRITRCRGEAIRIDGPATIRVNRRVTLIIDAPHEARIERIEAPNTPREDDTRGNPQRTRENCIRRIHKSE